MEKYYTANAKIDQHNRIRQDDLKLEHKLQTLDWSMRVNLSIFGVICVDTYLVYTRATEQEFMSKEDFFMELATELIDNNYDQPAGVRRRPQPNPESPAATARARHGQGIYLTPAKRKRKAKGKETKQSAQH